MNFTLGNIKFSSGHNSAGRIYIVRTGECGEHERGVPRVVIVRIHICTVTDEIVHHLLVTLVRRMLQRCHPILQHVMSLVLSTACYRPRTQYNRKVIFSVCLSTKGGGGGHKYPQSCPGPVVGHPQSRLRVYPQV